MLEQDVVDGLPAGAVVLLTHYWFRDGYGFAVISLSDDPRADEVKEALDAST